MKILGELARDRNPTGSQLGNFSLRSLLALTFGVCLLLVFLGQEPVEIALASLFCCFSSIAISILLGLSGRHLLELTQRAIQSRNIRILTQRFRWAYLDGLIIVWLVFGFSVSNYVVKNSIGNAGYLTIYCWFVAPLLTWGAWVLAAKDQ